MQLFVRARVNRWSDLESANFPAFRFEGESFGYMLVYDTIEAFYEAHPDEDCLIVEVANGPGTDPNAH